MSKRYYWLKLPEDFFDDETIQYIEEQDNGIAYTNFYLKLCLKALKTDGVLMRLVGEKYLPYDFASLARLTATPVDTVRSALALFREIGLITVTDSQGIYLKQLSEMVGSETDKAKLMRKKRAEKALEAGESNNVTSFSNEVTKNGNKVTFDGNIVEKCYLENRDKSIEIDKDINTLSTCVDHADDFAKQTEEIIDYLNKRTGKHYKMNVDKTKRCIKARIKEGFDVEDFKKVIEIKCRTWMGTDMEKYLRPETLFGTKFEGYLNEKIIEKDEDPF